MPPLDPDLIQEVFHKALALPESEREAFIVKTCDSNPDLEREVRELLAACNLPGGLLKDPVIRLDFVPDNLVGTIIGGRYRVERELSCTAMSQVYLASDSRLQDRPVVIKILSRVLVQDGNARQRFQKEVVALLRINHPQVVSVRDTGELVDERPYIVMSYVEGETLRTQIRTGGMDLERTASIMKQIGVALDHCHEQKIFHRDLKPENIMIKDGTDSVVLIDFGIAKVKESVTTVTAVSAGTLPYMAPEQLHGEDITAATDVYSTAVIAYEMVTGARPFNATSASQLADMQRAGVQVKPRSLRPNLPPRAQQVILRGLSFKRQTRYRTASQFCDELAAALNDGGTTEASFTHWRKYLIVALALAIVSFGVYYYFIRDGKPGPNRSFSYFLTVQPPGQAPYKSNGDETYRNGDKFQLTVTTPVSAYLYIFNERPPQTDDSGFTMVFPNQITNGSPSVGANQSVQSEWFTFSGHEGAENFWLVWSTSPVSELETATSEAAKRPDGALTGQTLVTVKQYLIARKAEIDATTSHYNANKTAVVRARHDLLVTLAQFKHR